MSNKKRIQKKISKVVKGNISVKKKNLTNSQILDHVNNSFFKFLETMAHTSASIQRALANNKTDFKTGGFIKSNPEDKEKILNKNKEVIIIGSGWGDFEKRAKSRNQEWVDYLSKMSRIDYNIEILNNPVTDIEPFPKRLVGQLGLIKTKTGDVKTVFAGAKDLKY